MARRIPPHFEVPDRTETRMYRLVRPFGRWVMRLWHRVEVDGLSHLEDGDGERPARLLFSGHQNGMADPVLACVSLPRQMHYFTRADVFAGTAARWFVLRLNMMPIFRPIDRVPDLPARNQRTFDAAHRRLDGGAWCGIFPEAGHLDERRTRRFKHGSARFLLGALARPAVRERGVKVQPMTFDFTRYEGYRTTARIRIGAPIALDGVWDAPENSGPNRIWLSDRMRAALTAIATELAEGALYDAHLAVCRFREGETGQRPDPAFLARLHRAMKADEDAVLQGFEALLAEGMPHPRRSDAFEGLGRLASQGATRWVRHAWRWPFWWVFMATTGWWPRVLERRMAKRVHKVAFRTTFAIPLTLIGVGITWTALSLVVALLCGGIGFGAAAFAALRLSQGLAMPLEDALIDRKREREAAPFLDHPWVLQWCRGHVPHGPASNSGLR